MASAAKPISRASAEKKLAEFLDRVRKVKEDDYFLYKVEKVIVFGSYLGSADLLSDIDLAVSWNGRLRIIKSLNDFQSNKRRRPERRAELLEISWTLSSILIWRLVVILNRAQE
jgi:predicted nucleotidyltransferase